MKLLSSFLRQTLCIKTHFSAEDIHVHLNAEMNYPLKNGRCIGNVRYTGSGEVLMVEFTEYNKRRGSDTRIQGRGKITYNNGLSNLRITYVDRSISTWLGIIMLLGSTVGIIITCFKNHMWDMSILLSVPIFFLTIMHYQFRSTTNRINNEITTNIDGFQ